MPRPQVPRGWRAAGIDGVALVAIALVTILSHLALARRGMGFDEPSWLFHFGRRALDGDIPYRDYVFHAGPLPIYVDALFQAVFGSTYAASMYAAMAITIARVFAIWMLVRRIAGPPAAALLVVWCTFDVMFAAQHASTIAYVQLFLVLAGLCIVLAVQAGDPRAGDAGARRADRRALRFLGLAGASIALVVTARPEAIWTLGITGLLATAILYYAPGTAGAGPAHRADVTRARFLALWGGFAIALVVVLGVLAIAGAAAPAFRQMFLDTPATRGHHGLAVIFNAISGDTFAVPNRSWWEGVLIYLGIPSAVVAVAIYATARNRKIATARVAVVAMAGLIVVGLNTRSAFLNLVSDLPRLFLTVVTVMAVAAPGRARCWFGVEPLVAIGLGALPVASSWALETALPGRGWSDATALVTGVLLLALATRHLAPRVKTVLCGALAVAALIHTVALRRAYVNPFAQPDAADGTLRETRSRSSHPIMTDLRINEPKKLAVAWLTAQVPPGATCFVFGDHPVLYDILRCTNPTRVDLVSAAAITVSDGEAAIAALRAHPPDVLVVQETALTDPPLSIGLDGKIESSAGLDPETSRVMRTGLSAILGQYESIGSAGEQLGEVLAKRAALQRDHVETLRLYRRKR